MTAPGTVRVRLLTASGNLETEVDACLTPTPGLVIHEAVGAEGWVITHSSSGFGVARFADPEAALAAATELGALADWSGPVDLDAALASGAAAVAARWGVLPSNAGTRELARQAGAIR
jgi:hypothetical protein